MGRQTRAQKVISQAIVACVSRLTSQGYQASQVMSRDWYSRFETACQIAVPFHQLSPCSFDRQAKT